MGERDGGYTATRDALVRLVDLEAVDARQPVMSGRQAVVALARMYGAEASTEHSRRWPRLGDVVPLATMTDAVQTRALEMTKRLRRDSRAQSFVVTAFEALESAMAADNATASAQEIKRQGERLLERASAAYARQKAMTSRERQKARRAPVVPWRRHPEGEDVD